MHDTSTSKTHFKASNRRALGSWVGLCILTLIAIYLSSQSWPLLVLSNALMTGLMWSWFSILHSAGHGTYFKNSLMNTIAGHTASIFVFVPYFPWKYSHQAHHQWTGYKNLDPSQQEIPATPPPEKILKVLEVLWKIGFPVISIWHFINSLVQSKKKQYPEKELFSQIFLVSVHATWIFLSWVAWFKFFLVPYTLFLILSDIVLTSQHAGFMNELGNPETARPKKLSVQEQVSRSFHTHPWLDRWVFLNFNLHSAHHQFPQVPHYDLHRLKFHPTHSVSLWSWWKSIKKKTLKQIFWGASHDAA